MYRRGSNMDFLLSSEPNFYQTSTEFNASPLERFKSELICFPTETSAAMATLHQNGPMPNSYTFPPGTPAIHANAFNKYHKISKALFVPGYYHQFILPTIPEKAQLPMDPVNWEFGIRPNRPFEVLPNEQRQRAAKKWPTRPGSRREGPTAYYLEQLHFWEDGPLPAEDEEVGELHPSGPLKRWFEFTLDACLFILAVVRLLVFLVSEVAAVLLATGRKIWKDVFGNLTWELVVAIFLATQIVRFLPGMAGSLDVDGGGRWNEAPPPLYVLMIPFQASTS